MKIGKLNRRVELLQFFEERDEYGGAVGNWRTVRRLWASIQPVSGTEYFQNQQITAETTTLITVRYDPRINVMHRIRYGEKLYEIIGVSDKDTRHEETVLNCKEKVDDELQRETEKGQSGCGGCG